MWKFVTVLALATVLVGVGASFIDFSGQETLGFFSFSSTSAAAIPEPGSLLLMGSGLAALAAAARRRMKARSKKTALA